VHSAAEAEDAYFPREAFELWLTGLLEAYWGEVDPDSGH
jgi:hypothetical protein